MFFNVLRLLLFAFSAAKEVPQAVKVALEYYAHALCIERVACEVAVVGLVVDAYGHVAVGHEQVAQVEVTDERRVVGGYIVAVAKLSVEE